MISINYTSKNPKQIRKILGIAGALLTLVIPYFIMLQNDNRHIETEQSLCPFKLLTGFPCPGCGITKSLVFLYEGDFFKSIQDFRKSFVHVATDHTRLATTVDQVLKNFDIEFRPDT